MSAKDLGSAIGAKIGEILDDTLAKANAQSGENNQMGSIVDSILDRLDGDNDDPTRRLEVIGANVGAKIGEMFGLNSSNLNDGEAAQTEQGSDLLDGVAGSLVKNLADKNGDGKVDMEEIAQTLVENFGKKA